MYIYNKRLVTALFIFLARILHKVQLTLFLLFILLGLDQPVWVKRELTVPWRHNARVGFRLQVVHCSDVTH